MKNKTRLGLLLVGLMVATPTIAEITLSVNPNLKFVTPGGTATVDIQVSGLDGAGSGGADEIIRSFNFLLGYDNTKISFNTLTFGGLINLGGPTANINDSACLNDFSIQSCWDTEPSFDYQGAGFVIPPSVTVNEGVRFEEFSYLCYDASDTACFFSTGPFLGTGQPDTFTLATVTFDISSSLQPGESTDLVLLDDRFIPGGGGNFDAKGIAPGVALSIALGDGVLKVAAAPLPGTLFLSSMAIVMVFRLRRQRLLAG